LISQRRNAKNLKKRKTEKGAKMEKGPQMTYYELLKALVSGKKVRSKCWQEHEYIKFDDGNLVDEKGERFGYINLAQNQNGKSITHPSRPKNSKSSNTAAPSLNTCGPLQLSELF